MAKQQTSSSPTKTQPAKQSTNKQKTKEWPPKNGHQSDKSPIWIASQAPKHRKQGKWMSWSHHTVNLSKWTTYRVSTSLGFPCPGFDALFPTPAPKPHDFGTEFVGFMGKTFFFRPLLPAQPTSQQQQHRIILIRSFEPPDRTTKVFHGWLRYALLSTFASKFHMVLGRIRRVHWKAFFFFLFSIVSFPPVNKSLNSLG